MEDSRAVVVDRAISWDEGVELVESSHVVKRLDLGHSMIYRLRNQKYGEIVVVSSSSGASAVLSV
jgi:hypothetical protein